jgi:predicted  nucleic acid-binding Zn-ribbon protein
MTDQRRDISLFISVARIESTLHAHHHELHKIPHDIVAIDRALADLDARDRTAKETLEKLTTTRRDTERKLREHEDHLQKCKSQQALVKTNEEYTAMIKEIGVLEMQIGDEEERILVLMDEIERAQKEAAGLADTIGSERARRTEARKALVARQAELAAAVERLTRERPKILGELSAPLLKRYERVAEKHRDQAVTRLDSEHCGVCGTQVPPQVAVEVRKGDQFITCPACGRILVHYAD